MSIPLFWVDAFTDIAFRGNPAAICLLDALGSEASDEWMQSLAFEMNISETAFVVPRADGDFDLRWFTPTREVELCGHATLAAAHVMFSTGRSDDRAAFHTLSGVLTCARRDDLIEMDFPAAIPTPIAAPPGLLDALGVSEPVAVLESANRWHLVELVSEAAVAACAPDFSALATVGSGAAIITARSDRDGIDIASRVFVPGSGINEDPVTGSAHCTLVPYWTAAFGRDHLVAYQASTRGGTLHCRLDGDRVSLAGHAVTVMRAELAV